MDGKCFSLWRTESSEPISPRPGLSPTCVFGGVVIWVWVSFLAKVLGKIIEIVIEIGRKEEEFKGSC